jgi:uncharacterized membrane protein
MTEVSTGSFSQLISDTGFAIEIVGVIVIVIGFALATIRMLRNFSSVAGEERYLNYRRGLARTMMLGLEFLVAGDIIRTVFVADTLEEVASLAIIVLIRTVLVFTLHLEIEGRWPWQPATADK